MEESSASVALRQDSMRCLNAAKMKQNLLLAVAAMCDIPTKATLCRLNRQVRWPLQMLLFQCVEIQGPRQLEAFARCVKEVDNDNETEDEDETQNRMRTLLSQIRLFIHRPFIPSDLYIKYDSDDPLFNLSQIVKTTKKGNLIFPRLSKAKLAFDRPPYASARFTDTSLSAMTVDGEFRACFLADVKQLWIGEQKITFEDARPAFALLGMKDVTTVHLSCKYRQAPDSLVARSLRDQKGLKTVIVHLQDELTFTQVNRQQSFESLEIYAKELGTFLRAFLQHGRRLTLSDLVLYTDHTQADELIPSLAKALVRAATDLEEWHFTSPELEWYWLAARVVVRKPGSTTSERPLLEMDWSSLISQILP